MICIKRAARKRHLSYVQQGSGRGIETMVHLRHPCAQGDEVLHGLMAVIIIQVALEGIVHGRQIHVRHCCSISLLQHAADLLYEVPNLWPQAENSLVQIVTSCPCC